MMERGEVERVLRNWIAQAMSPTGEFTNDVDRAEWVARNFLAWWEPEVTKRLTAVAGAANSLGMLFPLLPITRTSEDGDEALDLLEFLLDAVESLKSLLRPD
jgi:hypothetical protein